MIILASGSPRRKELMKFITDDFKIMVSDADEDVEKNMSPEELTMLLSKRKADAVKVLVSEEDVIISADTVVSIDGKILGKPIDKQDAFNTLKNLSGKTHNVITGVTVSKGENYETFSVTTDVLFYELTDDEINLYLEKDEYKDKAGSYGIQGFGGLFVEKITGDYNNVVGLPVAELYRKMTNKKWL